MQLLSQTLLSASTEVDLYSVPTKSPSRVQVEYITICLVDTYGMTHISINVAEKGVATESKQYVFYFYVIDSGGSRLDVKLPLSPGSILRATADADNVAVGVYGSFVSL